MSALLPPAPIQPVPPLRSLSGSSQHQPLGPTPDSSLAFISLSPHALRGQNPVPSACVMGFVCAPPCMLWLPGNVPCLFPRLLWWLANSSPASSLTPTTRLSPCPQSYTLRTRGRLCHILLPKPSVVSRHQYNPDLRELCKGAGSKPSRAQLTAFPFSSLTSDSISGGLGLSIETSLCLVRAVPSAWFSLSPA